MAEKKTPQELRREQLSERFAEDQARREEEANQPNQRQQELRERFEREALRRAGFDEPTLAPYLAVDDNDDDDGDDDDDDANLFFDAEELG